MTWHYNFVAHILRISKILHLPRLIADQVFEEHADGKLARFNLELSGDKLGTILKNDCGCLNLFSHLGINKWKPGIWGVYKMSQRFLKITKENLKFGSFLNVSGYKYKGSFEMFLLMKRSSGFAIL